MSAHLNEKPVPVKDLLFDPRYYLFDTLPQEGKTKFIITDEGALTDAAFVDIRFESRAIGSITIPTRDLVAAVARYSKLRPQIHFIFHHAFVCSTLLARCLNQVDAFISLKEPWILRRLADIKREHGANIPEQHWRQMYLTYLPLLAKRYATGRSLVIKATNVANNLIADVAQYSPQQKILYLYSDIESFLISNLKKSASTQQKMPGLLAGFLKDSDLAAAHGPLASSDRLTLLQTCALIWVCNIYSLKQTVEARNYAGLRTLDAQRLLDDTEASLAAVSRHFGHVPNEEDLTKMTHDDVLRKNAKDSRYRYSADQKREDDQKIIEEYRQDIDEAQEWISPIVESLALYEFMESFDLFEG